MMLDLGARHAIGIHWGSFQLTDEPREEPVALLRTALVERGIEDKWFLPASSGEVFDFTISTGREPIIHRMP
jgi:L-ascorbate metabolism protein UlaG (beta-lactamase superfamily)